MIITKLKASTSISIRKKCSIIQKKRLIIYLHREKYGQVDKSNVHVLQFHLGNM